MIHGVVPHSAEHARHGDAPEPNLIERAAHKIGPGLTLGYILLSIVGVVFETLLLRAFDTDFLTYAEPEDFLMAGLRHPMLLAFVALSVLIFAALLWFVRVGSRLSNVYAAWRDRTGSFSGVQLLRRVIPYFGVAYYFFVFTQFYAAHVAEEIRRGEEPGVRIEFQFDGANSTTPSEGYLVATTGRYIFLWEQGVRRMQVIPVTAVRRLVSAGWNASRRDEAPAGGAASK